MKRLDNLLIPLLSSIKSYASDPSVKKAKKVTSALWNWGDKTHESVRVEFSENGYTKECHEACDYCCYQNVSINVFEIIVISDWIRDNLNENIKTNLYENAKSIYINSLEDTNDSERWSRREPCACLDKESKMCIIYPVRPLECRSAISHDKKSCQANFNDETSKSISVLPPSGVVIKLPEETEFMHLINNLADYVSISLVQATSTYLMSDIYSKRELIGKFINPKTSKLRWSLTNMELNRALNFTLSGEANMKIKSLVRLKPDGVFKCAKTTDSMI